MATVAKPAGGFGNRADLLSGTPRAHALDRWIFVAMAGWFIVIVLTGFIPDSLMKIEMVRTGQRPPFPLVLHMHAVVMGSYLLFLLTQTWLMATGRRGLHMQIGIVGAVLAAALVAVGFALVPTIYYETWNALQTAPPEARGKLSGLLAFKENVLLLQGRIGILFPLFLAIGLRARGHDAGLHKRMMILSVAPALSAAVARMTWLPRTLPESPLSSDLYILLAVSPMFAWDVVRNGRVHRAWWIWLGVFLPSTVLVNLLWDTPGWHAAAKAIMGV